MGVSIILVSTFMWLSVPFTFLGWILLSLCRLICNSLKMKKLNEKYVLITGCDSGFGQSLAIKLSNLGMNVFAGCLTDKGVNDLKKAAVGLAGQLMPMSMDVTKDASVKDAKVFVEKKLPAGRGIVSNP